MDVNYSIKEILNAVDDLRKTTKNKNDAPLKNQNYKIDNSNIPKETLKLIEQAEKSKN
tara:strand:+ start:813 stop:986 length:174 start_codon:yes stop_codon:yes gene_type:complete